MNAIKTKLNIEDPILWRLLRGGFVLPHDPSYGLVVLLRGKPGTGKSTLALQILDLVQTEAQKYYCTLEQSKEDLRFKLSSMLVAQAIMKSRKADYSGNRFLCNFDDFFKHIYKKLKEINDDLKIQLTKELQKISLPLYEEPEEDVRNKCSDAESCLSELVNCHLDAERIEIQGSSNSKNDVPPEGPLGIMRSHVLLASRMLNGVLEVHLGNKLNDKISREIRPIIVIDGLSLLSVSEREILELQRIVDQMRCCCQVGILVYEPDEEESTSLDHHADMVIDLTRRSIERPLAYLIHEMSIRKARYQDAALGQHQFKIRSSGLAFFPSLHFQVHHYNYMDLEMKRSICDMEWIPSLNPGERGEIQCTQGSLIDMIFNPQRGESVVLLGSRNSFKTQLCLDFLVSGSWGCFRDFNLNPDFKDKQMEKGLLISLIDNAPDIQRGLSCPWRKSRHGSECYNRCMEEKSALITHACAFCQRPGCITPAEFFHYLKERIDLLISNPNGHFRLAFWDLTQMDYRFPLFREDKMLLPALMDMFKTKKLKSLLMGAGNAENTKAASAMADHVLFCWRSPSVPNLNIKETDYKANSHSSLMLYVDRTSAASHHAGKALYCIPIMYDNSRNDDKLIIPRVKDDLIKHLIPLSSKELKRYDLEMIENITNMQGVS